MLKPYDKSMSLKNLMCKVTGCGKRHHTLLCTAILSKNAATSTKADGNSPTPSNCNYTNQAASINNHFASSNNENVTTLLEIVPVVVKNGKQSKKIKRFA